MSQERKAFSLPVRSEYKCASCGHASRWHSHGGEGDCEHDGDCRCEQFVAATRTNPPNRIDLAAARALVSGYAPEEAVSVKAGSVLALIDAVEAAHSNAVIGGGPNPITFALAGALERFTFRGDATA